jgi:periplasmic divalent cation tolerance protein
MRKAKQPEFVWCYVTAKDARQADRLAAALVRERLAACANILGGIQSVYRWKGRVERGREVALILKTRRTLVPALTERIRKLHTYECPCVIALPVLGGNPDFLAWLAAETEPGQGRRIKTPAHVSAPA